MGSMTPGGGTHAHVRTIVEMLTFSPLFQNVRPVPWGWLWPHHYSKRPRWRNDDRRGQGDPLSCLPAIIREVEIANG